MIRGTLRALAATRWLGPAALAAFAVCWLAAGGPAAGQASQAPRVHHRTPAQPAFTFQPLPVPPAGTEASFTIIERLEQGLAGRSGAFLTAPEEELAGADKREVLAVRAHYTVLAPDPASGRPRVEVQAYPVDPATGQPLPGAAGTAPWRATYVLAPGQVEWVSGSPIPGDYTHLVEPLWLARWTLGDHGAVPRSPLQPGAEWESQPELELEGFPFGQVKLDKPVQSRFTGWAQLPGGMGAAAHLSETLQGGSSVYQEIVEGLPGHVSFRLNGQSGLWLLPGQFPYRAEKTLTGDVLMVASPETGAPPGLEGSLYFTFRIERTVSRALPDR